MIRTEAELFTSFRNSLSEDIQTDIDRYLYVYDMYLDESDPHNRQVLLGELNLIEHKYNLEVTHGASQNNRNQADQSTELQELSNV